MRQAMIVGLGLCLACGTAMAQKQPVARVNGQAITQESVNKTLMDWFGKQVLEEVIQSEVISQAAKKGNIAVTDKEVDDELAKMREEMDAQAKLGAGDSFVQFLGKTRRTEASLSAQLRTRRLLEKMVEDQAGVTDTEAAEFYEKNLTKFKEPAVVKVGVISLKTQDKAKEVRDKIAANTMTWGDAAREFNCNPRTMQTDGSLGPITESDNPVAKAAFALDHDGALSDVFEFGGLFNIVKREDRRNARTMPFEEARDRIKTILSEQKLERLVAAKRDELTRAAHIERLLGAADAAAPATPATGG